LLAACHDALLIAPVHVVALNADGTFCLAMTRLLRFLALGSLLTGALTLRAAEVGVIDWHTSLAGIPLTHWAHTAPSFHPATTSSGGDALVITATVNNVLAAIHPGNGTLGTLLHISFPSASSRAE
jgi:hypothetical protein